MDFHLNPEQSAFADAVRKFAEKELAPGALERAHNPEYPWAIAQKISQQGLLAQAADRLRAVRRTRPQI
jgi:alkylation response protein AidB-like acyl-CoA dehydrogenase